MSHPRHTIRRGIFAVLATFFAATPAWGLITATKTFSPIQVATGQPATLTVTILNVPPPGNPGRLSFTDTYPGGLVNAAAPNVTNTCGGTVTAAPNGNTLSLSGATTLSGNGSCSITVSVTSYTANVYVNTVIVSAANAGAAPIASAVLTVTGGAVGSFNAFETGTAAGAVTGVIHTRIAGSPFSLDVVAISGGAQATTFSGTVKVELLGNTVTGIALDAQNCPVSFTLLQTVVPNPAISGGRSTASFAAVADAWRDVRVRIGYPATAPTTISCSTDNFAVRPSSLAVTVADGDWASAGTARLLNNASATGGSVHKAGQPVTVVVTAYNAAAAVTGNYQGSPAVRAVACTQPAPACANGTLASGAWSGSGAVSSTATYSEAGSFDLTMQDAAFAAVDAGDGTPADCTGYYICSAPVSVGRFVPDHFVVTANNVPLLKTFNNAACSVRSFTYLGQPFGYATPPQVLVTAQSAANTTTTNYRGGLWKLAAAAGAQDCTTNPDVCALVSGSVTQSYTYSTSTGAMPNWDSAQVVLGTPGVAANNDGTGIVTGASGDLLAFLRSQTAPQPDFSAAIVLTASVTDGSETGCGAADCRITTPSPVAFNPVAFDAGNAFRYGRLKLSNAYGSPALALPVPMLAQYWNGAAFVTNTADHCTAIPAGGVALTLSGIATSAAWSTPFSSGDGRLKLGAPNARGYADIVVAAPSYLQGAWTGTTYNQNPAARAAFGVYKGNTNFIYERELY